MSTMHSLDGWVEIDCAGADRVRGERPASPTSSLTDMDGQYGDPVIFTEWSSGDRPVLRDYLWHPLERGTHECYCEHYVPEGGAA